jgi:copper chaperone
MRAREISLRVDMVCEGCAGAVKRICARIEGVESADVDVNSRLVVIRGEKLDPDDVCARVAKCGRETRVLSASA